MKPLTFHETFREFVSRQQYSFKCLFLETAAELPPNMSFLVFLIIRRIIGILLYLSGYIQLVKNVESFVVSSEKGEDFIIPMNDEGGIR